MSGKPCGPCPSRTGFTLIEVIGALVIFSVGVLMVISLSTSLSRQMERAAITSEIVVLAHERLDSLESAGFTTLSPGTTTDYVTVEGVPYTRVATITSITPLLLQIEVRLAPQTAGEGPSYTASSYVADAW